MAGPKLPTGWPRVGLSTVVVAETVAGPFHATSRYRREGGRLRVDSPEYLDFLRFDLAQAEDVHDLYAIASGVEDEPNRFLLRGLPSAEALQRSQHPDHVVDLSGFDPAPMSWACLRLADTGPPDGLAAAIDTADQFARLRAKVPYPGVWGRVERQRVPTRWRGTSRARTSCRPSVRVRSSNVSIASIWVASSA